MLIPLLNTLTVNSSRIFILFSLENCIIFNFLRFIYFHRYESRRWHQKPWSWSYRCLQATMWVQEIKSGSSGIAASAHNYQVISATKWSCNFLGLKNLKSLQHCMLVHLEPKKMVLTLSNNLILKIWIYDSTKKVMISSLNVQQIFNISFVISVILLYLLNQL